MRTKYECGCDLMIEALRCPEHGAPATWGAGANRRLKLQAKARSEAIKATSDEKVRHNERLTKIDWRLQGELKRIDNMKD